MKKNSNNIISIYGFKECKTFCRYKSFERVFKEQLFFCQFSCGSENVRINCTPIEYAITKESSTKVKSQIDKLIPLLKEVSFEESRELDDYILIEYIDNTSEYYYYDERIDEIFEGNDIDETIEDFSNPSTPYLVFDNNKYSKHIELYEIINNNIKNKQYKQIFNMLSDNCILEYINKENNQSEYSKQELFEIYKKAAGIFNYKIKKYSINFNYIGVYENAESKLKIELAVRFPSNESSYYTLEVDIENELIKKIYLRDISEIPSIELNHKNLYNKDLEKIKTGNYSDFE